MTFLPQHSNRLTVRAGLSLALTLGACSGTSTPETGPSGGKLGGGGSVGSGGAPSSGGTVAKGGSTATANTGGSVQPLGGTNAAGGTGGDFVSTAGSTAGGNTEPTGGAAGGTPARGGNTKTGGTDAATATGGKIGGNTAVGGSGPPAGAGAGGASASGGVKTGGTGLAAESASFHCFNWADPGDNFQSGVLKPTGLSAGDTYATVSTKADAILSGFKTVLGANSIRIPINEATIVTNPTWWAAYKGIIDTAISKNMNVMVAYWGQAGNNGGKPADTNVFYTMWKAVVDAYVSSDLVYFDIMNEPWALSPTAFIDLAVKWMAQFPNVPHNRVVVAGNYNDNDVNQQGKDSRITDCLLSLHIYDSAGTTAAAASAALKTRLGPYYNRTIVTEYVGVAGFLQGVATQMKAYEMGSCYWAGLQGTKGLATLTGTAPNYTVTVNNASTLTLIQSGWTAGTGTGGVIATGGTGGGTATGGTTGTGGATATGGTSGCSLPACYSNLVSACSLDGACVEQRVAMCGATPCPQPLGSPPTSIVADRCYASGVTAEEVTDTASTNLVTTVKSNGKACYSFETQNSTASPTSLPIVLKNPAGTTVATSVIDNSKGTAAITCAGGSAVVVPLDCLPPSANGSPATCTTGTCTP